MSSLLSEKNLKIIAVGLGAISALLAFSLNQPIILLISILSAIFIGLLVFLGNQTFPFLLFNRTLIFDNLNYEIPGTLDVVVTKIGEYYYATRFLAVKLYQSASDDPESVLTSHKMFEQAVINFKRPFKLGYLVYALDISEKRKELEFQRSKITVQLQKAQEAPNPDALLIDKLRRERDYWNLQIQKLEKGLRPMEVLIYAAVSAEGINKDQAIAESLNYAQELRTLLENALRAEISLIKGPEIVKMIRSEYIIATNKELLEEQFGKHKDKAEIG